MPRKTPTWNSGDPLSAVRVNVINDDIDVLYAEWSDRLKLYRQPSDPAFQVTIWAWNYIVWSWKGIYAGGTVTIPASSTRYIMMKDTGVVEVGTSRNDDYWRIGVVVTDWSGITSIINRRPDLLGGAIGGGGGFQNISSCVYSRGLLTSFIADWVSWTIIYDITGQVKEVSNGINKRTITRSWWVLSTTVKSVV